MKQLQCCRSIVLKSSSIVDHKQVSLPYRLQASVPPLLVRAGSPSRGGDVGVYVLDMNQPSLLTPFDSVRLSISVFMALSTPFHSINSPENSLFSHSVFQSYLCLIAPCNVSLRKSS